MIVPIRAFLPVERHEFREHTGKPVLELHEPAVLLQAVLTGSTALPAAAFRADRIARHALWVIPYDVVAVIGPVGVRDFRFPEEVHKDAVKQEVLLDARVDGALLQPSVKTAVHERPVGVGGVLFKHEREVGGRPPVLEGAPVEHVFKVFRYLDFLYLHPSSPIRNI